MTSPQRLHRNSLMNLIRQVDSLPRGETARDTVPTGFPSLDALVENPTFSVASNEESPEDYTVRRELSSFIQESLTRLPEDQRVVLILVDIQAFSYEEAAQILKTPVGTVKSRLSRAREAMRATLSTQRELLPGQFRSG